MMIDIDNEISEITTNLKQVEGYLDCEKIIIHNIMKHLDKGYSDECVLKYLNNIAVCLSEKIEVNQPHTNCTNYRYAAGFVEMLLKMTYWKSWMQTIKM